MSVDGSLLYDLPHIYIHHIATSNALRIAAISCAVTVVRLVICADPILSMSLALAIS